jgi:hypothetical protein
MRSMLGFWLAMRISAPVSSAFTSLDSRPNCSLASLGL